MNNHPSVGQFIDMVHFICDYFLSRL